MPRDHMFVYNWELDAFIEGGFSAAQRYANVIGNHFIKGDPVSVGGFGTLHGGDPPAQCAGDGIPDYWKLQYGLDPCTYAADGDFDVTGYTNIEKYINGLVDGSY